MFFSCDNESIEKGPLDKKTITVNNIGEIHNYLLDEYLRSKPGISLKSKGEVKTFGEVYRGFEKILANSDKYSMSTTIKSTRTKSGEADLLKSFADLKVDANFNAEIKKRFISHVSSLENVDKEVVAALLSTLKDNLYGELSEITDSKGSELISIYNNVFKSSSEYWAVNASNTKASHVKRSATNKEIIWSDAAGAILGAGCGGVMSILMGAAFSNCAEEIAQMN